jgi:transcriptional regulator with XRE-family HTH domain
VDERETLGKYLKNQRESKKISLREVAKNTRVRENILRTIEEEQYDLLPPATYVKGFLLAYAKYLRLDPNDVLLRYERVIKGEPVPSSHIQPQRPKRKVLWNANQTWVVVGVILTSFILFYFFYPFSPKHFIGPVPEKPIIEKPIIDEKPSIAPSPPVAEPTSVPATPPPLVTATPSVPEKGTFSLKLKAIEETWLNLQVDDQSNKEAIFEPGDGISIQASNRIQILVGNAGGLHLIFNGKPMDKLGESGEVVTLIFTSEGVEVKRHRKSKPD